MSRPGARRRWSSIGAVLLMGVGFAAAQTRVAEAELKLATQREIKKALDGSAQYRDLMAKVPEQFHPCLLEWAVYFELVAAAVEIDGPQPVKPALDVACGISASDVTTAAAPEPVPQAAPVQNVAAVMFDGLRYDVGQVSGANTLPPEIRRKIDALDLIMDDLSAAQPNGRAAYLEEFLSASAPLVTETVSHPYRYGLLILRTAAFLELNRMDEARETGQQLVAPGAAVATDGPTVRRLMATLERKGWLVQPVASERPPAASPVSMPMPQAVAALPEARGAAVTSAAPPVPVAVVTVTETPRAARESSALVGSNWSGSLMARNKERPRQELVSYPVELTFTEGGRGTVSYRRRNLALTWTQTGKHIAVSTELSPDCLLALDISMEGENMRGAANWAGDVDKNALSTCFDAAGGVTDVAEAELRLFFPSEFSATRMAAQPAGPPGLVQTTLPSGGGSSGNPTPVYRVSPVYPDQARRVQLEGWVRVQFNIAADGSVKDAKVADASSPGVFDAAALDAVSQWRYEPPVVNGVVAERAGDPVVISFKMPQ